MKKFLNRNIAFWLCIIAVILVALAIILHNIIKVAESANIETIKVEHTQSTPINIENMRQIGQWEFLTITDEELVDTTKKRLFTTYQLVRIYYGTLRLGIDMGELRDSDLQLRGDTVHIAMPKVRLLDDRFIDEARTRSFYEEGTWSGKERDALYNKAVRQMKARCLTRENYAQARQNGIAQLEKTLSAMGAKHVVVE